jgi:hypothetical protein
LLERHVRRCAACAQAVEDQREIKRLLRSLPGTGPSPDLVDFLASLDGPQQLPRSALRPAADAGPHVLGVIRTSTSSRKPQAPASRPRPRRLVLIVAAAVAVAAVIGVTGTLYVLGAEEACGTELLASAREIAKARNQAPAGPTPEVEATLDWLERNGWDAPGALPSSYTLDWFDLDWQDMHPHPGYQYVTLGFSHPSGSAVLVMRRAHLKAQVAQELHPQTIGGSELFLADQADGGPATAGMWETAHGAVAFAGDIPSADIAELAGAFPGAKSESVSERLGRGWRHLAGS